MLKVIKSLMNSSSKSDVSSILCQINQCFNPQAVEIIWKSVRKGTVAWQTSTA